RRCRRSTQTPTPRRCRTPSARPPTRSTSRTSAPGATRCPFRSDGDGVPQGALRRRGPPGRTGWASVGAAPGSGDPELRDARGAGLDEEARIRGEREEGGEVVAEHELAQQLRRLVE